MKCRNCDAMLDGKSLFCTKCGTEVRELVNAQKHAIHPEPLNIAFSVSALGRCQMCGVSGPTKYVEFYYNIGMILARRQGSVKGTLCKNCIHKTFRQFTIKNFFLGWWGTVSFFATGIFMINNIFRYIMSIGLQKPSSSAIASVVTGSETVR